MSLALLERDCGHADRALALWTAVAALEADDDDEDDGEDDREDEEEEVDQWAEAWILEPRRQCVPLAAMYAALTLTLTLILTLTLTRTLPLTPNP